MSEEISEMLLETEDMQRRGAKQDIADNSEAVEQIDADVQARKQPRRREEDDEFDNDARLQECLQSNNDASLIEWLKGLDNNRGALVGYLQAIKREFDGDLGQLAACRL